MQIVVKGPAVIMAVRRAGNKTARQELVVGKGETVRIVVKAGLELLLVNHGAAHNDTIVTVERKNHGCVAVQP